MAPIAPWEADDDQLNALAQQLRQSTVECSALNERINKKNEEVAEYRKARDDAEARARMEEDRARALEAKATKALEVRVAIGSCTIFGKHSHDQVSLSLYGQPGSQEGTRCVAWTRGCS